MAAVGGKWGRRPGYRRRRPLPALVVLVALVVLSGLVWTNVFDSVRSTEAATTCNPPAPASAPPQASGKPAQVPLGQMEKRDALDPVTPIPPQDVHVRVLNGNGESRQASLVSSELHTLGFSPVGADNDAVYVNYDLKCHGQIRYGAAGANAARTLSLIAPCAQLVRDERTDPGVDFALGKEFDDIKTSQEAKQVMQQLQSWVPQRNAQDGAREEVTPPKLDKELLTKARDVHC